MLFSLYGIDKPDGLPVRESYRPAHRAYLEALGDKRVAAGPLLSDDGQVMIGSLIILDCEDLSEARSIAANDPYALAGLFESMAVRPWLRVFPKS